MRLALKLTTVWLMGVAIVLAIQGMLHSRALDRIMAEKQSEELSRFGDALSTAAARIWRDEGETAARAYVEENDRHIEKMRIEVVEAMAPSSEAARSGETEEGNAYYLRSLPFPGPEDRALRLEWTPGSDMAELQRLAARDTLSTILLTLLCGALAVGVGYHIVGKPMTRLAAQARRVAEGDFRVFSGRHHHDEIGGLAREMNHMAIELEKARRATREANGSRTALLEQLRHADRLSTVGKLASGIAHELGTPLNVIAGRAGLIVASEDASDTVRENAAIVVEQAQHMTHLIRQMLDFSRRKQIQLEEIDVQELLESAVELLEPIAEKAGVETRVEVDVPEGEERLVASIDGSKALQVITNLLMNALQASEPSNEVELRGRRKWVDTPSDQRARPGNYLEIEVADQGAGMELETLEHIFEPFFTTKSAESGTGLGLSVSHGIVRDHGGWIDVMSAPGEGTCFSVHFPLHGNEHEHLDRAS